MIFIIQPIKAIAEWHSRMKNLTREEIKVFVSWITFFDYYFNVAQNFSQNQYSI